MLAVELGLVIFVLVFVPAALLVFKETQRKSDQEQKMARLERKLDAVLAHLGIRYEG